MLFNQDDGEDDEYFKRIREQKEDEMESRRRALVAKGEIKQRLRQYHIKRKEAAEIEEAERAKEAAELKVRQLELTERLAKELSRRKEIERQEDLKSRKKKSVAPAISDCTLQKINTELIKKQKQDEETQASQSISRWCFTEVNIAEQQEKKLNYRKELQNQMISNRRRLREKEEEKHRERKIMEEAGDTLHSEDLKAERKKQETAVLLQAERKAFFKAREFWKEKRREVLKQEHDEVLRIVAKKAAQEKMEAEEKTDTLAIKETLIGKLAGKLMEEERKRMEREEICRELYLAEKEEQLAKEAMKLMMEKKRTAKELLQDMVKYQKAEAEKKAKENAIDAAFAKYLAEERRNLEERERQEKQARRERNVQYGNELREIIVRNRLQRLNDYLGPEEKTKSIILRKDDEEDPKTKCNSQSVIETWKSKEEKPAIST